MKPEILACLQGLGFARDASYTTTALQCAYCDDSDRFPIDDTVSVRDIRRWHDRHLFCERPEKAHFGWKD